MFFYISENLNLKFQVQNRDFPFYPPRLYKSKVFAVIFKLVKIIPFKIRSISKNWCCFFGKLVLWQICRLLRKENDSQLVSTNYQSLFSLQFYLLLELGKMYYVWLSTESILIWGFKYLKVRKFLQFAQV